MHIYTIGYVLKPLQDIRAPAEQYRIEHSIEQRLNQPRVVTGMSVFRGFSWWFKLPKINASLKKGLNMHKKFTQKQWKSPSPIEPAPKLVLSPWSPVGDVGDLILLSSAFVGFGKSSPSFSHHSA